MKTRQFHFYYVSLLFLSFFPSFILCLNDDKIWKNDNYWTYLEENSTICDNCSSYQESLICGRPIDYKNNMFIEKNTAKKCLLYTHQSVLTQESFFKKVKGKTTLIFVGDSVLRGIFESAVTFFGCRDWRDGMTTKFHNISNNKLNPRRYMDHVDLCKYKCYQNDETSSSLNLGFIWSPFLFTNTLNSARYWSIPGKNESLGHCVHSNVCKFSEKRLACDASEKLLREERNNCGHIFDNATLSDNFIQVLGGGIHDAIHNVALQKCSYNNHTLNEDSHCIQSYLDQTLQHIIKKKKCWKPSHSDIKTIFNTPTKLQMQTKIPGSYPAGRVKHARHDLIVEEITHFIKSSKFLKSNNINRDTSLVDLYSMTNNTNDQIAAFSTKDGIHYHDFFSRSALNEILHKIIMQYMETI